eukprot:Colp12_sorted_trinity150504_noHs@6418
MEINSTMVRVNSPVPRSPNVNNRNNENIKKDTRPRMPVTLVVGGQKFKADKELLRDHPNSMLGRMFGTSQDLALANDLGEYELEYDIPPNVFKAILEFYNTGKVQCPPGVSVAALKRHMDYFLVPFTWETVKCQDLAELMHELSNNGARVQFERFLDRNIKPVMYKSASIGERECHITVLFETDVIEWDKSDPPDLVAENGLTLQNTSLCRFLRYFENRSLAKEILEEKGLKKVKIGIEGFPTYKHKISKGYGKNYEYTYNYEQRPFIQMSWEKEEHINKSRHVVFQCVKAARPDVRWSTAQEIWAEATDEPTDNM